MLSYEWSHLYLWIFISLGLRCISRWPLWCKRKQDNHKVICWRQMKNRNVNCWCSVAKLCLTLLWLHGLKPFRLLCPWVFPGKNTGVGCHFLLQGVFLTWGWTHVSRIDEQNFYLWATRKAPKTWIEVCILTRVLISPDFCSTSLNGLFQGTFWKYSTMPMDLWSTDHF